MDSKYEVVKDVSSSVCVECGDDADLMVSLTKIPVCGKCVRKNYRKAVGR